MNKRVKQQNNSYADTVNDNNTVNASFKMLFLELPDKLFYDLLRIRLKLPVLKERDEVEVESEREYWVHSYTIDQLFNEMSATPEIVTVGIRRNHVYKYRDRALKIFELFRITNSNLDFVINFSDLSPRLIAELKVLDKKSADYVVKQAVDKIFESINSERYYNLGVSKRLKVRFDR